MIEILVITAHPDDEVIWFGSTLYQLTKFKNININVICLWSLLEKPGSMAAVSEGYIDIDRKEQFYNVCKFMNFSKYYLIFDNKNKSINQDYNEMLESFNNAINKIKLENIHLIITHSYYGDEKKHPGHIITHNFSKKYAKENNIPFSYFTTLQIPNINHVSILNNYYRKKGLHLLNLSKCNDNLYYVQFQGNLNRKIKAVKLYKAVDFNIHFNHYMSLSLITEGLYFEYNALHIINNIIDNMTLITNNIL
jgi:LmbE family N-acetylglucosaminyl deacetylase